ncbi:MAG TPA: hypothetical protein VFH99_04210, partial [Candidatus Saccharimonadales bacterium]|nr:hypothetical protein [Candidatus Saccharimonadales bacterium]
MQLEPLHIGPEIVEQLEAADCKIKGVRYFTDLYEDNGVASIKDQLQSLFVGSVAHGKAELVTEAYNLLVLDDQDRVPERNAELVEKLDEAMKYERWHGRALRYDRLAAAAKVIGKPLKRRLLGGLATAQATYARGHG